MRAFARLLSQIEQTNSTNQKVDLMSRFFARADPETAAWALYFLAGRRPKKFISSGKLRAWAEELARIPPWLSEECYSAVGDSAEMIALILAPYHSSRDNGAGARGGGAADAAAGAVSLAAWMNERLGPLRDADESIQRDRIQSWWRELSTLETYVLNKLMTGSLRIGVSETLVYRAIAQAFELPRPVVAARLLGNWKPSAEFYTRAIRPVDESETAAPETEGEALPEPFCLAAPIEVTPESLGPLGDWQLEWKWDGIRAQAVKRGAHVELWSRGEERITESFPDLAEFFGRIPGDFTLDGEILAGNAQGAGSISGSFPGSFNDLQKRLNRKSPSASMVRDHPVAFLAYDYLRAGGDPLTALPLSERRERLEREFSAQLGPRFGFSPLLSVADWAEAAREQARAREQRAEGLMIKRRDAPYATGRKRGIWFKWKVDPLTLDVVLTAAQPGTGRRASLYTDYTFGIWKDDRLVPIAKAYSGLTDEEIRELDGWIRRNTLERHGPVRMLKPERVFEIGFEGIGASTRHKSGFAVRFPRILRERLDKPAAQADRVETVHQLLASLAAAGPVPIPDEGDQPGLFGATG